MTLHLNVAFLPLSAFYVYGHARDYDRVLCAYDHALYAYVRALYARDRVLYAHVRALYARDRALFSRVHVRDRALPYFHAHGRANDVCSLDRARARRRVRAHARALLPHSGSPKACPRALPVSPNCAI